MQLHEISLHEIADITSFDELRQHAEKLDYMCEIFPNHFEAPRLTRNDLWPFKAILLSASREANVARKYTIEGGFNEDRIYVQAMSYQDIDWWG